MTPLLEQYIGSRKLTPGKHRYKYPSKKMGMQLVTESPNECNFCEFLEFDSRVKGFISQPKTITYDLYQNGHRYTADFLADLYLSNPTFFEIKPKGYEKGEEEEDKFYEIEKVFNDMGFNFVLVTGDYIEKGNRLKNFKKLRQHIGKLPERNILEFIERLIFNNNDDCLSFNEVQVEIKNSFNIKEEESIVHIYKCLANKKIGFDIDVSELNKFVMIGGWNESFNRAWNGVPIQE